MPEENNKVLIEVAAQHPLVDGLKPQIEFELRLKKALQIYEKEKKNGNKPIIYVPGSLHSIKVNGEWQTDKIPLSEAGRNFLVEHGIPEESIRSEESNRKYKKDGVYNSGDECLVAAEIAKDEDIDRIISIVSPVQTYRKALFYLEYGFEPEMYGIGLEKTAHNYVGEAFWSLFITYFVDRTWQNSFLAAKTREERNRYFNITKDIEELILAGIKLPDEVLSKRAEWMNLYKVAQEKLDSAESGKWIAISADDNSINFDKLDITMDLLEQARQAGEEVTICIYGKSSQDFQKALNERSENDVDITCLNSFEQAVNRYKATSNAKLYHISDSPSAMKDTLQAMKKRSFTYCILCSK